MELLVVKTQLPIMTFVRQLVMTVLAVRGFIFLKPL